MRKHMPKLALMAFLALLLVALPPLAAACGDEEEGKTPAAEEKEITIGGTLTFSGPYASLAAGASRELQYLVRYINEVEGGIDGIKIKFVWADDKFDAATAAIEYKRMKDRHHPILWLTIAEWVLWGVKDMFERDKTPVLIVSAHVRELFVPPGMIFTFRNAEANLFTGLARWVLQDLGGLRGNRDAQAGPHALGQPLRECGQGGRRLHVGGRAWG